MQWTAGLGPRSVAALPEPALLDGLGGFRWSRSGPSVAFIFGGVLALAAVVLLLALTTRSGGASRLRLVEGPQVGWSAQEGRRAECRCGALGTTLVVFRVFGRPLPGATRSWDSGPHPARRDATRSP